MVADPTVLEGALIVLGLAVIVALVVGRFDEAPLIVAVLASIALGLLAVADSLILLYYTTLQPNDRFILIGLLLVLLPGLGALFAAVLTVIGIVGGLIWSVGHRRFRGLGVPLLLAALAVELVGIVLITTELAGAWFVPPLESHFRADNNTIEAISVACMTLAALGLFVGAFVTLHRTRSRVPAASIAPAGRGA